MTYALNSSARHVVLFHDGPLPPACEEAISGHNALQIPQSEGDLGDRLRGAVAAADQRGLLPMLILGSDSPDLPAEYLEEALTALTRADVVLGPAPDGGVWCIGVAQARPGLFSELPWSQNTTGEALRNRVQELELKLELVASWSDVDLPDDLMRLTGRLREGQTVAPATWAHLQARSADQQGDLT